MMRKIIPFLILSFYVYLFVFACSLACVPLADAANSSKAQKQTLDVNEKMTTSKSPIHITADRMEAHQDERTIIFENHVVVQQDDVTITSNKMKVVLLPEENKPAADGPAQKSGTDGQKTATPEENKPAADGPAQKPGTDGQKTLTPVLNKTAPDEPTASQRIDYIQFDGDVKYVQQDRVATGKQAIFYQQDQKVVLHGKPVVTKGPDRVEGDLITIFLKEGKSIVEGNVKTDLIQEKKE
jgi:lipopolysaccharide export system protein LptA